MRFTRKSQVTPEELKKRPPRRVLHWTFFLSWGVTFLLVAILVLVLVNFNPLKPKTVETTQVDNNHPSNVPLPDLGSQSPDYSLIRMANLDTTVPAGTRQFPVKYTIEVGDSIFAIAKKFKIKPETILWANYDLLKDDPTLIKEGWSLTIPPVDGIFYKWNSDDSLQKVAEKYFASVDDIINWPSNRLDITNPITDNLEFVMIPGGYRPLQAWIIPLPFAPRSGATRIVAGPGGCQAPATGPVGSTEFNWPTVNTTLSGFDFSSYHLGIDIAAGTGAPVYAADSGTVIYSGWNGSGYGNLIEIDHNNGYQTLYAHLSTLGVSCGQQVFAGMIIGYAGSTGKSTGAHLHFEVRKNGGFVNPWQVLP
ncbi:MAG: peptidoglycan DD-metalloendopeptidase family protein [Chloroflexi bacterium]|nr:peptidoglycan DD-metalloendopeptidase family protein [Chloroflexota bacterium]